MLDYPALAALAQIIRRGSFEAAAASLGVTPSAISQRIKALEERMGEVLIHRGPPARGTDKALQSGANVAGGLAAVAGFGGLRFGKTRKFEFAAKPGNYEEGAAKAASLASQMLIGRLSALR